jgi:hypothetical protein
MKTVKRGLGILLVFMLSAMLISCMKSASPPTDEQIKQDIKNYFDKKDGGVWKVTEVKINDKSIQGDKSTILANIKIKNATSIVDRGQVKLVYQKFDTGWECFEFSQ